MIKEGIYFNLSAEDYHTDEALGSTSLKTLLKNPANFWFERHSQERRDTAALSFGRQLHVCVLEGEEKFKKLYAPLAGALNTKVGKEEAAQIKNRGKEPIKKADFDKILQVNEYIKLNKPLAKAFQNGAAEVSVFWTDTATGLRFKARFDYLKKHAIIDLKSIAGNGGKPFDEACMDAIASYEYLLSAAHYIEARKQMNRLFESDAVIGEYDKSWLSSVVGSEVFAFVFVFWQKTGAPLSKGIQISPQNPLLQVAAKQIQQACQNYQSYREKFGDKTPWLPCLEIEELTLEALPFWYTRKLPLETDENHR